MQILPVNYGLYLQQSKPKHTKTSYNIHFQAAKSQLIPITATSFKTESAKKMYSKIFQYFQRLGSGGNINDAPIMKEKGRYYNEKAWEFFDSDANIYLTINKTPNLSTFTLKRKYSDTSKGVVLLDAVLNKDGQMIKGRYPLQNLIFERSNRNAREIRYNGKIFSPLSGNDREWASCTNDKLPTLSKDLSFSYDYVPIFGKPSPIHDSGSSAGAFEIFMELTRLHTSIFK